MSDCWFNIYGYRQRCPLTLRPSYRNRDDAACSAAPGVLYRIRVRLKSA